MSRKPSRDHSVAALAYFRTREGGPSLEEQERLVAEAAEAHGLTVMDRMIEAAAVGTGELGDRRVKLFELLAEAQSGKARAIVISGARAIAENPVEAAIIAIMLERRGCKVLFADGFDPAPYRDQASKIVNGVSR